MVATQSHAPASASLVDRLLQDIADPTVTVASQLRTAKIIATKLGQSDALRWIDHELKGYGDVLVDDLPTYRQLSGHLQAWNHYFQRWDPILFPTADLEMKLTKAPIGVPVGSLENSLREKEDGNGSWGFSISPEFKARICKAIGQTTEIQLRLDSGHLFSIVDAVRNLLLDWALALDNAHVAGMNMDFTPKEKQEGRAVTQQFFIQNAGVVGNVNDGANVTNNQTATINLDIGAITAMVQQARGVLGSLPQDLRDELTPQLDKIEAEAAKQPPDRSVLRELLTSARNIAEQAAGNLAATGIVGLISSILGGG